MPKNNLESDAEYQRRRMMTRDERAIGAREDIAKALHEQNQRDGKNTTYDEAHRKAEQIANKVYREEQERK